MINIDLNKEQVEAILKSLWVCEHEGMVSKEMVSELYWAFGEGHRDPFKKE